MPCCIALFPSHNTKSLVRPFFCSMLAVDDVASAKSRLNFHFQTPHTSFSSVRREIMSLGRLIPVVQQQLQDLRSLIAAVTGPEKDFLEDAEVPCAPEYDPVAKDNFVELPILVSGYFYYFDITRALRSWISSSTRPYSATARKTRVWRRPLWSGCRGMGGASTTNGTYPCRRESLAQHRGLDEGKGLQTCVSCLFRKYGEMDVPSYSGTGGF